MDAMLRRKRNMGTRSGRIRRKGGYRNHSRDMWQPPSGATRVTESPWHFVQPVRPESRVLLSVLAQLVVPAEASSGFV